jgi:hypothetical protein
MQQTIRLEMCDASTTEVKTTLCHVTTYITKSACRQADRYAGPCNNAEQRAGAQTGSAAASTAELLTRQATNAVQEQHWSVRAA